ncbi:MAG: hypothetical protein WAK26_20235 [Terracidiphilus sp.]
MNVRRRTVQLKDEVYRQMFRLEEGRPGAEMGLATALLQAWIATDLKRQSSEDRDWLKKISPICLQMIEAALKANVAALPSEH